MKRIDRRKEESERKILETLEKSGELTFMKLLAETKLARSTLANRLKELLREGKIERYYNTYRTTKIGIAEIQVESMIKCLGVVATHFIVKTRRNLPIKDEFNIYKEINEYLKGEPKNVSWEELDKYLEEKHPVTI